MVWQSYLCQNQGKRGVRQKGVLNQAIAAVHTSPRLVLSSTAHPPLFLQPFPSSTPNMPPQLSDTPVPAGGFTYGWNATYTFLCLQLPASLSHTPFPHDPCWESGRLLETSLIIWETSDPGQQRMCLQRHTGSDKPGLEYKPGNLILVSTNPSTNQPGTIYWAGAM